MSGTRSIVTEIISPAHRENIVYAFESQESELNAQGENFIDH